MRFVERQQHIMQGVELPRPNGISAQLAALLYARGAKDEAAMRAFLHPDIGQLYDPMLLKDMDKAVARIRLALDRGERITVYGDYDTDGVCSTAMLVSHLATLGADVAFKIPNRHDEGYGMNLAAIKRIAEEGTTLIVTVDNGVRAHDEIACAKSLGMDVVVTDHHRCTDTLPDALAVVCTARPDDAYPNHSLCGAGIALKLIHALSGEAAMQECLPLAALASMADVVPILNENRAIVALGLKAINENKCKVGLKLLRAAAGESRRITGRDLAFVFAPRLNAAYRMEDATQCVELLCTDDEKTARAIVERLNALNDLRKKEEADICASACEMVDAMDLTSRYSIVLRGEWNPGVVGIAAARLVERYHRPTLLLCESGDTLTGSARSVRGMDIYAVLCTCEDCFIRFGGHAYAAGLTMQADRFEEFKGRFEAAFASAYPLDALIPKRSYEAEITLEELGMPLLEELELLSPFGEGNARPVFRSEGVLLSGIKRIGDGSHIKATAVQKSSFLELIGFNMGSRFDEFTDYEYADVLHSPSINEFRGQANVQLRLVEARPCAIAEPVDYAYRRRSKFTNAFSHNIMYNDTRAGVPVSSVDVKGTLCGLLKAHHAGVLILCFTEDGTVELAKLLAENGFAGDVPLRFFVNTKSPAAYNEAVAAPVLEKLSIDRFTDIVVFDTPVTEGVLGELHSLAPNASLYVNEKPQDAGALIGQLTLTREEFIPYYRAIKDGPKHYNRESAVDYLVRRTDKPSCMCELALNIMEELGFIDTRRGVEFIADAGRRELGESKTFCALEALTKSDSLYGCGR